MRVLSVCLAVWLLAACTEPPPAASSEQQPGTAMPPGFLDTPPPPPTSSTQVLSGGTLVADRMIEDSVVVLTNGTLVAWGKRGEVAMPNDSVGFDLRGHWIMAGSWQQAAAGELPLEAPLPVGEAANLVIVRQPPPFENLRESDLGGRVVDGKLELFDAQTDG